MVAFPTNSNASAPQLDWAEEPADVLIWRGVDPMLSACVVEGNVARKSRQNDMETHTGYARYPLMPQRVALRGVKFYS